MNTVELITKKRDGLALTEAEIEFLVRGYTAGNIPDYQMSAFLMAVYFNGMEKAETVALTQIMRDSGDVVDLSAIEGTKVDKHSTGGVGDKTTLIVGPMAAACGVPIAKMSGRGLGFTGGTIDKLEAIPGYKTSITEEEFMSQVNTKGISVIGQTGHIAPADKKIYALRDVTGTVENLSLITSSIMSKKLAAGSDAILLDVKCGSGAFMKTREDAESLAELMVEIGNADGKDTMAVITDMEQPLGKAIGNALEVREAIDVLKNDGPEDITELCITLAGLMIYMGKKAISPEEGMAKAKHTLEDGSALEKFKDLIEGQGGDISIIEDYDIMPKAEYCVELKAWDNGYIESMDAMKIGLASQHTGAGRESKEDVIDLSTGIILCKKIGDTVTIGETVCKIYVNDMKKAEKALEEVRNAVIISSKKPDKIQLIKKIIK